jgi:hypothetical protein
MVKVKIFGVIRSTTGFGYLEVDTDNMQGIFDAISEKIRSTYLAEKAVDAVELIQDDNSLTVKIAYCPAVKHLCETGREISQWFSMTTSVVMDTLAKAGNLTFEMEHYDPETGAARYRFS